MLKSEKQNPRWSASRFGAYNSCRTKYLLTYIWQLVVIGKDIDVQEKGLAFHQIAEFMDSTKTLEDLKNHAATILEGYDFDQEKYPVIKAIPRFYLFWNEIIKPYEEQGFTVTKESWEYSAINKKSVVGAMDLLLINEVTKEAVIIDFKTGSTAKINGYENQLMLYAYMIKNKLKTKYDKIKTYAFFPMAGLKDEDVDDIESTRKFMLKTFKQLIFTEDQVKDMISEYTSLIKASENEDWDNLDLEQNASMAYHCNWCSFAGHPDYCPTTYKAGVRFARSNKIMTKEQLDILKKEKQQS